MYLHTYLPIHLPPANPSTYLPTHLHTLIEFLFLFFQCHMASFDYAEWQILITPSVKM